MSRPSSSRRLIQAELIQAPTRVRLHIVHDSFWSSSCFHHDVNVIGPYMSSQQIPATFRTPIEQRIEHRVPARVIHAIGTLAHALSLGARPARIGIR
jgi:hypothetical protein